MTQFINVTSTSATSSDDDDVIYNVSVKLVESSQYMTTIYGYISPIVVLLTVVTNTLVCVVLLQPNMRTPTNILLVAMAIADSLTGAIPVPSFLYFYTYGAYVDYVPYGWCHVHDALTETLPTMCHTASIWLTVALSAQRYIYVCRPTDAKRLCTVPGTGKAVAAISVTAALSQVTKFFERSYHPLVVQSRVTPGDYLVSCYATMAPVIDANRALYFGTYWWFRVIFIHIIPCSSLVVLNVRLFIAMRAAQQVRRALLLRQNRRTESRRLAETNLATLMLLAVVGVFLLVEFPLAVLLILLIIENTLEVQILADEDRTMASLFINLCILLSYPANFFIYCGMSRQFRSTFARLFLRVCYPASTATTTAGHANNQLTMTDMDGKTYRRTEAQPSVANLDE